MFNRRGSLFFGQCLLELLGDKASSIPVQIFATDVSEKAIEKARTGIYKENITADMPAERLRRFFVKLEHRYQVNKYNSFPHLRLHTLPN